jgi:hypothetical protein
MGIGVPIAWSFAGVLAYLTFLYDVNLKWLCHCLSWPGI